jgi:hypothetical protein
MKRLLLSFICGVFFCSLWPKLFASEFRETSSIKDVFLKISEKSHKYGPHEVLVVFDIDNTLLKMNNDLGSDQWFSWQEKMMDTKTCSYFCVANDFENLLKIQGILFSLGRMNLVENEIPLYFQELKKMQVKAIFLTSRNIMFRSLTEKALRENNIESTDQELGTNLHLPYSFLPYNLKNIEEAGITSEEAQLANLKEARPVTFYNGLYMTSGQHKGVMLKSLLHKYKLKFKAIIFVDDHQKHVDRMYQILGDEIDLTAFRYTKLDSEVVKFHEASKEEVKKKWEKLSRVLEEIGFPIF